MFLCFLPITAFAAAEDAGRGYYDFGVFAFEDGDYDGALQNLQKALSLNPANPFYQHYLGKTFLKLKRYENALTALSTAMATDPDIVGLEYDLAMVHYKMEDFQKSAGIFEKISSADPANVLAQYHAGISYYKNKKFARALKHLEAAAEKSPSITANGLYYAGICHLQLGNFDQAVERFTYVKNSEAPATLKSNADKWLELVEKQRQAFKPYSLRLDLSSGYDDNVRLEPLDRDDLFANEGDYFSGLLFSGKYNFLHRMDRKAGIGFDHLQNWYQDLNQFDIAVSSLRFFAQYRLDPLTFAVSYSPSYSWLDDQKYMLRQKIRPEVHWKINDRTMTRFSYSYSVNNNFQDQGRGGHTSEIANDSSYAIQDKTGRIFGGLAYEENAATAQEQEYDRLKANLGVSLKVPYDMDLTVRTRFNDKEYRQVNTNLAGIKRHDKKYDYLASLSRRFLYDWLRIVVDFTYTKNNSNVNIYNYRKKMGSISLSAKL